MARTYRWAVEGFRVPRPVIIEATSAKDAAQKYAKIYYNEEIRRVSKVAWEAPERKIGRKHEGQVEQEREDYKAAVKEFLDA